jgi:CheY-like chemotaxis protein
MGSSLNCPDATTNLPHTSARQKILIVEDEILIAMDLQGRLEELGYDVPGRADSAESALDLALSCVPDLILMDIRLRGVKD